MVAPLDRRVKRAEEEGGTGRQGSERERWRGGGAARRAAARRKKKSSFLIPPPNERGGSAITGRSSVHGCRSPLCLGDAQHVAHLVHVRHPLEREKLAPRHELLWRLALAHDPPDDERVVVRVGDADDALAQERGDDDGVGLGAEARLVGPRLVPDVLVGEVRQARVDRGDARASRPGRGGRVGGERAAPPPRGGEAGAGGAAAAGGRGGAAAAEGGRREGEGGLGGLFVCLLGCVWRVRSRGRGARERCWGWGFGLCVHVSVFRAQRRIGHGTGRGARPARPPAARSSSRAGGKRASGGGGEGERARERARGGARSLAPLPLDPKGGAPGGAPAPRGTRNPTDRRRTCWLVEARRRLPRRRHARATPPDDMVFFAASSRGFCCKVWGLPAREREGEGRCGGEARRRPWGSRWWWSVCDR